MLIFRAPCGLSPWPRKKKKERGGEKTGDCKAIKCVRSMLEFRGKSAFLPHLFPGHGVLADAVPRERVPPYVLDHAPASEWV